MKTYWDSSALIELLHDPTMRTRLKPRQDATRPHSLAEIFSTLTKGINFRYSPDDAAKMIFDLAEDLDFVELTKADTLSAVKSARRLGVRGARIHDLMHATAARKYAAQVLLTLNTAGFEGISQGMTMRLPG